MGGGLKVTPEQLQALAGMVVKTAGDADGMHKGLTSQLQPLFGADWAGAAAAQFHNLYEQFDRSAANLAQALEGIGKLLGAAGQSYAQAEQQIAASFRI